MDAILGFLSSPAFLTIGGIAWSLAIKYWPPLAKFPNALIPYLNAAVALVTSLGAAGAGAVTTSTLAVMAGYEPAEASRFGIAGAVFAAGWQAVVNSLIYEVFLKHPLERHAGLRKAKA